MPGKKQWAAAGLILLLLSLFVSAALAEEYRELKKGMSGEDVQRLKKAMYWLGYFSTEDLDGRFTEITEERVKRLQKNNGFKETGVADAALQALVFSGNAVKTDTAPSASPIPPPTPEPSPTPEPTAIPEEYYSYRELSEGMSGEDVLRLKKAMYWLGYFSTQNLSDEYTAATTARVQQLQKNNGLKETGVADAALQVLVFSGNAVKTKNAPRPSSVPTPEPTPKPPYDLDAHLPPRTEEGFLTADAQEKEFVFTDPEEGAWVYLTPSLSIVLRRYADPEAVLTWYEADIQCSPDSPLISYTNGNKTPGTSLIPPGTFVKKNGIVLGISDDHFGYRITEKNMKIPAGIIIRNGNVISEKTWTRESFPNLDILAVFQDGSMKTFDATAHTAQEYLDMGVVSTYSFGPILIQNGELSEYMLRDEYYTYREPRIAMGMIAPYHYYVLCVEGRMADTRSKGVYLTWLADNMLSHGVVEGLNLDGGGTAALMFMGEKINKSPNSTRSVGSMTGFGVSTLVSDP